MFATAVIVLALSAGAVRAQTTIGELAPPNPDPYCVNGPVDSVPAGPGRSVYTVPANGLLTSWSTNAGEGDGQTLTMKVYRPAGPDRYLVAGLDGPRPLQPGVPNTFPISLPVQAGDLIGVDNENANSVSNACVFQTGNPLDSIEYQETVPADRGETFLIDGSEFGVRVNLTATLLRAPAISAMSPASGSIRGGTQVTLTGSEFAQVRSVTVGGVPAAFTAASESQITLTVPPTASLAPAPVIVTTAAGTATAPVPFTYLACRVSDLAGKKLRKSKRRLRKAKCSIGKVKLRGEATAKSGRVVKQNPKPGSLLAPGTKVNVTVGLRAGKR